MPQWERLENPPSLDEVLDWIKRFIDEHDYPPSHREIQAAFGIPKRGQTHALVARLERNGMITVDRARKHRNIKVRDYAPGGIISRLRAYVRALEWYVNELERGNNPEPARIEAVRVRSLLKKDDLA